MRFGIRHEDGTLLNEDDWQVVKASARKVISLILLPLPFLPKMVDKNPTMSYFRSFHRDAWYKAIEQLEEQQPLLRLCAEHYKAQTMLSQTLAGHNNGRRRSKGGGEASSEGGEGGSGTDERKETMEKRKSARKGTTIKQSLSSRAPTRKSKRLRKKDSEYSNIDFYDLYVQLNYPSKDEIQMIRTERRTRKQR
jgi:hypothetical protein